MAETPTPQTSAHGKGISGFLSQKTAGLPNWAWLLVVAAGIAAAVIIPKFLNQGGNTGGDTTGGNTTGGGGNQNTGGDTTGGGGSGTGGGLDLSGLQDLLKQFQDNMKNQGNDTGGDGGNTGGGDTGGDTGGNTGGGDTKNTPKPYFQTRPYGKEEIQGSGIKDTAADIPIRDKPGGNVIRKVGFGQRITITGDMIAGPNNYGPGAKSGQGSTHWYPVSGGGYISAFDVERHNMGSTGPVWPTTYIRTKHMRAV
jgi:hypothetical protein